MARKISAAVKHLLPIMPDLRSLNLSKCYQLTPADLRLILQTCPKLQSLNFEVCGEELCDLVLKSLMSWLLTGLQNQ